MTAATRLAAVLAICGTPATAQAALSMGRAERKIENRVYFKYPNRTEGRIVTARCHRVNARKADCTYKVGPDPFDCGRYGDCRRLHGTGTVRKTDSGYLIVNVTKPR